MKIEKIIYAAADENMGSCSESDCDAYRAWAKKEISMAYPDADVEVVAHENAESRVVISEMSYEASLLEDDTHAFLTRLWERCPWDFV